MHVTKRLCGIPSFFNLPLCKRINELYGDPDSGACPAYIHTYIHTVHTINIILNKYVRDDCRKKYLLLKALFHRNVRMFASVGIPAPRTIGKNSRNPSGVKIKLKTFLKFWQFEVVRIDTTYHTHMTLHIHTCIYFQKHTVLNLFGRYYNTYIHIYMHV